MTVLPGTASLSRVLKVRPLLALFAALLGATAVGCGGGGKGASSTSLAAHNATVSSRTVPSGGYLKNDGDADEDDKHPSDRALQDDQSLFLTYGGKASPTDTRTITALVKSYLSASAAGDGAKACSLLAANLAIGLGASQGQSAQGARGTCAAAMSRLLEQQREQLAAEDVPTMVVTGVHVKGDAGLAIIGFRTMPESEIVLQREGSTWKVSALFATDVT